MCSSHHVPWLLLRGGRRGWAGKSDTDFLARLFLLWWLWSSPYRAALRRGVPVLMPGHKCNRRHFLRAV